MKTLLTLGRLARAAGLARASLLHYESLGLLSPERRSAAGYRLYGEAATERLRLIRLYRAAGLSLAAICDVLAPKPGRSAPAILIEARLLELSVEAERLRSQQQWLARLLATREFRNARRCASKAAWTSMLRRAGFSDDEMRAWHVSFEADSPTEHAAFLKSLGLGQTEIVSIRRWSRAKDDES